MADIPPSQWRRMKPWLKGCLIAAAILFGLCLLALGLCLFDPTWPPT